MASDGGGSARGEDELARTATAPGSGAAAPDAEPLSGTLGRYRLERELGAGGMGVVHAAFDPDLERRVALKVLRTTAGGSEARQRLLREARAMARLTHANVVTVHEVGSANGRDYVAMELVDGVTLADWLKAAPRTPHEIVSAFVAAGRGLAAAHAAGLVHRDFKPHNVLRRNDARIVVTDFGLARGVEIDATAIALETTLRMSVTKDAPSANTTPSSLSGLTATGSVLGTPAYMAPEQWSGGQIGPAADQFAFCVALWEALTGERPFKGATLDELKASVQRGVAPLDLSKLPRRLRRPLRRGLEPDPAKRWPSMDALLAAITRAERRPGIAIAIIGAALVAGVSLVLVLGRGSGDDCRAPLLDPGRVWAAERAAKLAHAQSPAAAAIQADVAAWRGARARACHGDPAVRSARLGCLDAVIARLDFAASVAGAATLKSSEVADLLVDPAVCERPRVPRLATQFSPAMLAIATTFATTQVNPVPLRTADVAALLERAGKDPCATALARMIAVDVRKTDTESKQDLEEAAQAAQLCGDDRLVADVEMLVARQAAGKPDFLNKVKRAEAALETVNQPDEQADLDMLRAVGAKVSDHIDEAIARTQAAFDGYARRGRLRAQLGAGLRLLGLRQLRAHPEDLAAIPDQLAQWRALAVDRLGTDDEIVRAIDAQASDWQFANGDVAGSHARDEAMRREIPNEHPIRITGRVVDPAGAPVAGAQVAADRTIYTDAIGVRATASQRRATTGADGRFTIEGARDDSVLYAQKGDLRSYPVLPGDDTVITLQPTSRVEGKVDLRGQAAVNVTLVVRDPDKMELTRFSIIAPIQHDGSFSIDGVPRAKDVIAVAMQSSSQGMFSSTEVTVKDPVVRGVQLAAPAGTRTVHVIVRSTVGIPLVQAQVLVSPGHLESTNAAEFNRNARDVRERFAAPVDEHAPQPVLAQSKRGDLYATIADAPEGEASACAVGLPTEVTDPDLSKKVLQHTDKIEVRCVPVAPDAQAVVVEVPPWPRFD